jgi:putative peptidoglycan lipid II flippase
MDEVASQPLKTDAQSPSAGLASAALLMVVVTFASAVVGMVRTMLFAWRFGNEGPPNAFFQASRLPDLVYFLIAGGALRSGFVPVFAQYWAGGRRDQAWRTFSSLFWLLVLVGASVVAVGIAFSPQLAVLIGPGWVKEHRDLLPLCAKLMRLMFPAQFFFVLGGLLMGTLNALKHFFWPGVGPILYNLTVVAAIVAATSGPAGLTLVALAVPVGALLGNVLVQLPPLRRLGGRLHFLLDLRDEGLRRTLAMAAPVIFGLAVSELNFLITSVLATICEPARGPATLVYANLLWRTPARIFGGGIAIALFPSLAYHFAEGATENFRRDFVFAARAAWFLAAPATLALILLREPVIGLLYQRGQFDRAATATVAGALLVYALAIVPTTLYYLVARAFYACHDTRTPVTVAVFSLALCAGLGWLLMVPFKIPGLATATVASSLANVLILWWILARRLGGLGTRRLLTMMGQSLLPLLALAGACGAATYLTPKLGYGTMLTRLLTVAFALLAGGAGYLGLAAWLGMEETRLVGQLWRRRRTAA